MKICSLRGNRHFSQHRPQARGARRSFEMSFIFRLETFQTQLSPSTFANWLFSSNRPHFPPPCFLSGSCVQTSSGCKACLSLRPPSSLLSSTNVFFTLSVFMFSRPRFFDSQLRRSIASRSLAPRFSILALAWNAIHNVCIFPSIGFLFTKNW